MSSFYNLNISKDIFLLYLAIHMKTICKVRAECNYNIQIVKQKKVHYKDF